MEEATSYMNEKKGECGNAELAKEGRFKDELSKKTFMSVQAPEEIIQRIFGSL